MEIQIIDRDKSRISELSSRQNITSTLQIKR